MGKILVALFILSFFIIVTSGCGKEILPEQTMPINEKLLNQDEAYIAASFNPSHLPKYPGYSSIKVLKREGEGIITNPRVLTIQITLESYPTDVTVEGELHYFVSDPAYEQYRFYGIEGLFHMTAVSWARHYLRFGSTTCENQLVLLVLKRWIDEGWIALEDIPPKPRLVKSLEKLLKRSQVIPSYLTDAGLIDTAQIPSYDLFPELPDNEKEPIYILRSNGVLELYLKKSSVDIKGLIELSECDLILGTPIPNPYK